jgi:hypothetical protein
VGRRQQNNAPHGNPIRGVSFSDSPQCTASFHRSLYFGTSCVKMLAPYEQQTL